MRKFMMLFVVLGVFLPQVFAQTDDARAEADDWHVILYDQIEGSLFHISSESLTEVPLPAVPISAIASYDGHYVAMMYDDYQIGLADMWEGLCCDGVFNPFFAEADQYTRFGIGAINPDATQLVLYSLSMQDDGTFTPAQMTVIAPDGTVLDALSVADIAFDPALIYPYFGDWTPQGVELLFGCFPCDGVPSGNYAIWIPGVGGGFGLNGRNPFGDYLAQTGESIVLVRDENYDLQPEEFYGPFNAIHYVAGMDTSPMTIYVDPDANVPPTRWIMDGAALILHENEDAQPLILKRDGSVMPVDYAEESRFLAGTPDGWLAVALESGEVTHYVLDENGELSTTTLSGNVAHTAWNELSVIAKPRLGATINEMTFASAP